MATLSGWKTFKSYANMATSNRWSKSSTGGKIFPVFPSQCWHMPHGESNNFPPISPLSWLRYRFHEHERSLFILWNTCCGCLRIHLIFRLTEKHYSLVLPFLYKENMTVQLQSMWDFTKWKQHMAISCLNWKEEIEWVLQVCVFPSCWWPLSSRLVVGKGRTILIIPFLVSSAGLFELPCFCLCKSNSVLDCMKHDLTSHVSVITLWQLQYLVITQNLDEMRPLTFFFFFTLTGCVISTFMRELMSFVIIDES